MRRNCWFALDVMKNQERKWDWVALMLDVDPDDLKNCICDFPAKLYVPPDENRPGGANSAPVLGQRSRQAQELEGGMGRPSRHDGRWGCIEADRYVSATGNDWPLTQSAEALAAQRRPNGI